MNIRTFFGILPLKLKYSGPGRGIDDMPLPREVVYICESSADREELGINKGDTVKSGQRLGPEGHTVYSSVTGEVSDIYEFTWTGGEEYSAIKVEVSESEEWDLSSGGDKNFLNFDSSKIKTILSGAGFDISVLDIGENGEIIVSALDSDLNISVNQSIFSGNIESVKTGIELLKKLSGRDRIKLALPDNLSGSAVEFNGLADVVIVSAKHPNGMPDHLPRQVLKEESAIRESRVIGVELLNAMANALSTGRPFIEKVLTVTGRDGNIIKNLRVRMGTTVSEVLRHLDIPLREGDRAVLGGPMTGRSIYDADFPVTRETDGIYLQGIGDTHNISNLQCMNCGRCVNACPYNLQVNLLSRYAEFSFFEKCEELDIGQCIECGLCAYVCTAGRPIVQYFQFAKKELDRIKEAEEQ